MATFRVISQTVIDATNISSSVIGANSAGSNLKPFHAGSWL
jgi:hypothetical protein